MRTGLYARIGVSLIMFHALVTRPRIYRSPASRHASGGFPSRRSPRYGASVLSRFRREDPFSPPHNRELRRFGADEFSSLLPPPLSLSFYVFARTDRDYVPHCLSLAATSESSGAFDSAGTICLSFPSLRIPFGCTSCRKVPFDRWTFSSGGRTRHHQSSDEYLSTSQSDRSFAQEREKQEDRERERERERESAIIEYRTEGFSGGLETEASRFIRKEDEDEFGNADNEHESYSSPMKARGNLIGGGASGEEKGGIIGILENGSAFSRARRDRGIRGAEESRVEGGDRDERKRD